MTYRIELAVIDEIVTPEQKQTSRFGLTLHNLSDRDICNWTLHFSLRRYISPQSLTQGQLQQTGGYCILTPPVDNVLAANSHFYVEFSVATAPFHLLDDGLDDAFLQVEQQGKKQPLSVSVAPINLASPYKQRVEVPHIAARIDSIIPVPARVQSQAGHFDLTTPLVIQNYVAQSLAAATWLAEQLAPLFATPIQHNSQGNLCFVKTPTLQEEEYKLEIQSQQILLEASSDSGFIHASASLWQLISQHKLANNHQLACQLIVDKPRFAYRCMMLDCARHFHPVDRVKRLINQLAQYKFNTFHWHLTDDEGWRIEIKALPQLTEVGAWRGLDCQLEAQYSNLAAKQGGFYSQDEIRDVIAYAAERSIMVIPEIDIPGHCRAAIKSLPELLVDRDDRSQYRSIQYYNDNILSPGLTGTYQFIDTVLTEVAELFPAPYVHIGADEVPQGVWTDSPSCQALMQQHGYQDTKELQGHLLRYTEDKLQSLGKRMMGWEEVQHGDKVSTNTVVYSWMSEQTGLRCANQGFDVVLQPAQYTYLDIVQDYAAEEMGVDWAGVLPLEKAYSYEPLLELAADDPARQHILGIQCALWCEIVDNQQRLDYMIFPRLLAVAEACWSDNHNRNWLDFLARLNGHLPSLQAQAVQFRPVQKHC